MQHFPKHSKQNIRFQQKYTMMWIPSHIGILGNQLVDDLASKTARLPNIQIYQHILYEDVTHIHKKEAPLSVAIPMGKINIKQTLPNKILHQHMAGAANKLQQTRYYYYRMTQISGSRLKGLVRTPIRQKF